MSSIRERAIKDCRRYSQSSFNLELTFYTPDMSQSATVLGKGQDTNIQFKTDGQDVLGQLIHISFIEALILEQNDLYPTRNSKDQVDMHLHLVKFQDSRGVENTWQIKQIYPDNLLGIISADCAEYEFEQTPGVPQNLVISDIEDTSFIATVDPPSNGLQQGYEWDISQDNGETYITVGETSESTPTFTFSPVLQGGSYIIRCRALGQYDSDYTTSSDIETKLTAPINFADSNKTETSFTGSITSLSEELEDGFQWELSENGGVDWDVYGTTDKAVYSFDFENLTGGVEYIPRVKALGVSDSNYLVGNSVTTKQKLPTPSDQTITNVQQNTMQLHWVSNIVDLSDVENVEITISGGLDDQQLIPPASEDFFLQGLDPLTEYLFSVKNIADPLSEFVDSLSSPTVGATTLFNAPDAPTYTNVGETTMTVNWASNSGGGEDGFKVLQSTDDINFAEVADVGSGVLTAPVTGLTQGIQYYFKVVAYIGINEAESSSSSQYAKLATTTTPTTGIASTTSIQVNWNNPAGGVCDTVRVYYRYSGGSTLFDTVSGTSTGHTITGLSPNITYTIYTQRIGFAGQPDSNNSGSVNKKTVGLGGTSITTWENDKSPSQNVNLNYNSISGASEYYIWFRTNNGSWRYAYQTSSTSEQSVDPRNYGAISGQPLAFRVAGGTSGNDRNNPGSPYATSSNITYT